MVTDSRPHSAMLPCLVFGSLRTRQADLARHSDGFCLLQLACSRSLIPTPQLIDLVVLVLGWAGLELELELEPLVAAADRHHRRPTIPCALSLADRMIMTWGPPLSHRPLQAPLNSPRVVQTPPQAD